MMGPVPRTANRNNFIDKKEVKFSKLDFFDHGLFVFPKP